MRPILRWLAIAATPLLLAAGNPAATPGTLIECERRFAADAAATGTRAAFLRHMAESGVVFRPGPVNARLWWEARPAASDRLEWTPEVAELSSSGDLGWTSGPWTFRADSAAREADARGHYLTVWRHHEHEGWKAVIDGGVSHGGAAAPSGAPDLRMLPGGAPRGSGPLAARQGLWKADEEYGRIARREGVAAARRQFGASDLRVLSEGSLPRVGHSDADSSGETARIASNAQFISEAADLGYTYGTEVRGAGAAADTSWYLHVWRRSAARRWELAAQVRMPLLRRK